MNKMGDLSCVQSKIPTTQLRAWLLAAVAPTILSVIGRNTWTTVLLMALGCSVLCFCVLTCRIEKFPKWLCILELGWLTVFLAGIAKISGSCWEKADAYPWIPIILLILAACASSKGVTQSARTGAILLWLVIPVLGLVFLAGTTDIDTGWIPTDLELPDGLLIAVLLTPCVTAFLPKERKVLRWTSLLTEAIVLAGTILIYGTLGEEVAKTARNGFYEFSKGVTLFGVAERFEPLVACALTGGLFAYLMLLLSTIYHLTEKNSPKAAKWIMWLCAILAVGVMCILPNRNEWMAIGGVIFWGFLPAIAQGIGGRKNIEKK